MNQSDKRKPFLRTAKQDVVTLCPYCEEEIIIPADIEAISCPHCDQELQAPAQRAYARGYDYFEQALELAERLEQPGFERPSQMVQEQLARLYRLAYSALQVAIQWELPADQKELTVGMLADISSNFQRQGAVSPLEADYWSRVSLRIGYRQQHTELQQQLEDLPSGIRGLFGKLRLWPRQRYLNKMLEVMDEEVAEIEHRIQFVEPPKI